MGIQIGARPDAGFDDPLGMLKDCHRRIEHFLHVVCVVAERPGVRALTQEEAAAIQAALSYFRSGGMRHTRDEEDSLFPRMRAAGVDPEDLEKVGGLEHDHRHADLLHTQVDQLYTAWLHDGSLSAGQHAALRSAIGQLKTLYARHIEVEEKLVFPRAAERLNPQALAEMGQEFRQRRSLQP